MTADLEEMTGHLPACVLEAIKTKVLKGDRPRTKVEVQAFNMLSVTLWAQGRSWCF